MKFTIDKKIFNDAFTQINRAISNKTMIPILQGAKISASNSNITLTGSNSDITIQEIINADEKNKLVIDEPGDIVLEGAYFYSILKSLPGQTITIEIDDKLRAKITSGKSNFTVNGNAADNYPKLPEIITEDTLKLSGAQLSDIISETIKSALTQDSRPILTGIHLRLDENSITAIATDSHRLAQRKITSDNKVSEADVVVPAKSLNELRSMIEALNILEVQISIGTNQIMFQFGDNTFYSNLLEGTYPETDRLIPTESTTSIQVSSQELAEVVSRVSVVSTRSRNNTVKLVVDSNRVTFSAEAAELGDSVETLEKATINGEPLTITFNPDFLKDALSALGANQVILSFTTELRPFTVIPSDVNDESQLQLITPVRTF